MRSEILEALPMGELLLEIFTILVGVERVEAQQADVFPVVASHVISLLCSDSVVVG
jgi:hypothetical protein